MSRTSFEQISLAPGFTPWHCPHLFPACLSFSNLQLFEAVRVNLVTWLLFLIEVCHDQYIINARPVGAGGIRVGATGRPTPYPKTGENRHSFGSEPWRDTAA